MAYSKNLPKAIGIIFEKWEERVLNPIAIGFLIGLVGGVSNTLPKSSDTFNRSLIRILKENISTYSCLVFISIFLVILSLFWAKNGLKNKISKHVIRERTLFPDWINRISYSYLSYSSVNIGIHIPLFFLAILTKEDYFSYLSIVLVLFLSWILIILLYLLGYIIIPESQRSAYLNGRIKAPDFYSFIFISSAILHFLASCMFLCLILKAK